MIQRGEALHITVILSVLICAHAADRYIINPLEQKDVSRDVNGAPFTEIRNLTVGDGCRWNYQCRSGCCAELFDSSQGRRCGELGVPGKSCSTTNVKGGYFVGACPCIDPEGCTRVETARLGKCRTPKIHQEITIISTTVHKFNTSIPIRF